MEKNTSDFGLLDQLCVCGWQGIDAIFASWVFVNVYVYPFVKKGGDVWVQSIHIFVFYPNNMKP